MPFVHSEWTVLPHKPIEKLEENLWRVQGSLPRGGLRRVMTLVRLGDGRVVIHNGICLDEAEMAEIEAWGTPSVLIVPNGYHRLDAPAFKARYPGITVLGPAAQRKAIEKVLPLDGDYGQFPDDPDVRIDMVEGVRDFEGYMTVKSGDTTTLVFNDTIFNCPHGKGVEGFVFKHITQSTGGPRVSRVMRMLIKDKKALGRQLAKLADTPNLQRVIVSHHRMIEEDPAGKLREVAASL